MHRDEAGWIAAYTQKDAYWLHDGKPGSPHAELASGKHSNGFFNSRLVIADDALLAEAADDLIDAFIREGRKHFSRVIGPQTGATRLAELLSDQLHGTKAFSPAKGIQGDRKCMVFSEEEVNYLLGRAALLCEDVITTGDSVELAAQAVERHGGSVLPFVLTLVNRSGQECINGRKVIALIRKEMPVWEAADCPLCKQGSQAIRPKDNWYALTGRKNTA